uniref:Uncharacterized protein n=1 Tax=Sipha flava TaxID=143950 RepID=A0A2S2R466_9HEMI
MFTKIISQANYKNISMTPMSKKKMPKFYKTSVALRTWGQSGLAFGVTGFVLVCYVTEWRTVLQYVPYYNGKYAQMDINEALDKIRETSNVIERKKNAGRDFQQERDDAIIADNLNKEEIINLVAGKL